MDKTKLEHFLSLLDDIVDNDAPWTEKKKALLDVASEDDETNLREFVSWFETDEILDEEVDPKEDT